MPFSFKPPQADAQQKTFDAVAIGNRIKENKGQIFTFLCFLSLGVMVFVCGVLYTYQRSLYSTVEEMKAAIQASDAAAGSVPVDQMVKLSKRLKVVGGLVNKRTSANTVLRILEETIDDKSIYKQVDVKINQKEQFEVTFAGETVSYKAVVQQTEAYKLKPYAKYVIDSELVSVAPADDGSVKFSYKLILAIRGSMAEDVIFDLTGATTQKPGGAISGTSTGTQ
jgi:hypothetical protein